MTARELAEPTALALHFQPVTTKTVPGVAGIVGAEAGFDEKLTVVLP